MLPRCYRFCQNTTIVSNPRQKNDTRKSLIRQYIAIVRNGGIYRSPLNGIQKVEGSSPLSSTQKPFRSNELREGFFLGRMAGFSRGYLWPENGAIYDGLLHIPPLRVGGASLP